MARILGKLILLAILIEICNGRELSRRQKRDDIFGGLGNIINQLIGGGNSNNGNTNNVPPNNNNNGNGNTNNAPPPTNPNKGPIDPNGKAAYCDSNPADCQYLNCLAENFQHSEQSNNIKMGGKILTDPQLRHALRTDPTVSQAACDKIGLDSKGCDGFKSFLGLIDKVSPNDGSNPHDPNRGKRSPAGGLGVGLGANVNVGNNGNNGNQGNQGNNGNNGNHGNNGNQGNNGNHGSSSTTHKPQSTSRPKSQGSSGSSSSSSSSSSSHTNHGGSGKGHGSVDYSDYYESHHTGGSGSGGGSGAGSGNNQPAYTPKDCQALLPKQTGSGNGNGRGNGRGNGNNGNHNGSGRGNNNSGGGGGLGGLNLSGLGFGGGGGQGGQGGPPARIENNRGN